MIGNKGLVASIMFVCILVCIGIWPLINQSESRQVAEAKSLMYDLRELLEEKEKRAEEKQRQEKLAEWWKKNKNNIKKVRRFRAQIIKSVAKYGKYGFDFNIVSAIMFVESGYNPKAISPSGASGLMQLKVETAQDMGVAAKDIFNPDENIRGGIKYLNYLYGLYADIDTTILAYNKGLTEVDQLVLVEGIEPSSYLYVQKVRLATEKIS